MKKIIACLNNNSVWLYAGAAATVLILLLK